MRVIIAGVSAVGVLLCGMAASATVVNLTFTGTVTDGMDYTGVFGAPGTYYASGAFSETFTFDLGKAVSAVSETNNGDNLTVYTFGTGSAGPAFGAVTIAFNGQSFTMPGDTNGQFITGTIPVAGADTGYNAVFLSDPAGNQASMLGQSTQLVSGVGSYGLNLYGAGYFWNNALPYYNSIDPSDPLNYSCGSGSSTAGGAAFCLNLSAPKLAVTLGAPEPGGWALMLVGIGGLGAVLRRGRLRPARSTEV